MLGSKPRHDNENCTWYICMCVQLSARKQGTYVVWKPDLGQRRGIMAPMTSQLGLEVQVTLQQTPIG